MSSAYIQLLLSSHKLHKNEGVQTMIPVVLSASSFVTRFTTSGGVFLSFYLYRYVPSHIILWGTPRGHRHVWAPIAPASPLSTFIASNPYPAIGAAYLPWKLLRGRRTLPSPQLLPFLHRKRLPCGWPLLSESVARAGPRPLGAVEEEKRSARKLISSAWAAAPLSRWTLFLRLSSRTVLHVIAQVVARARVGPEPWLGGAGASWIGWAGCGTRINRTGFI